MKKISCLDCGRTIKNFDGSQTCCSNKIKLSSMNLVPLRNIPQIEFEIQHQKTNGLKNA